MIKRPVKTHMGKEYPSVSEAARELGVTTGSIFNCLAGKTRRAAKLKWTYND